LLWMGANVADESGFNGHLSGMCQLSVGSVFVLVGVAGGIYCSQNSLS